MSSALNDWRSMLVCHLINTSNHQPAAVILPIVEGTSSTLPLNKTSLNLLLSSHLFQIDVKPDSQHKSTNGLVLHLLSYSQRPGVISLLLIALIFIFIN